jgi:excisionase family DNA binding protein
VNASTEFCGTLDTAAAGRRTTRARRSCHIVKTNLSVLLMTVPEVADLLRTTEKAIYEMHRRGQLPGERRIGRRLLFERASLLDWLDHKCAPSRGDQR